jgi:type II restriction/modification system DNA methylase subunit YeeA
MQTLDDNVANKATFEIIKGDTLKVKFIDSELDSSIMIT